MVKIYRYLLSIFIICLIFFLLSNCKGKNDMVISGKQTEQKFTKFTSNGKEEIRYLLYLPEDFKNKKNKFPLILFFHGSGESGVNLQLIKKNGIPKIVEKKRNFPFVVISPQYELDRYFRLINQPSVKTYDAFFDFIINKYNIDKKRIYITGLSYGGYLTWKISIEHPERFAAIAPVCGFGVSESMKNPLKIPEDLDKIKDIPIHVFHGENDDTVPIFNSIIMVDALKKIGANVKLTIYPNVGHNSWVNAYEKNNSLYNWFLKQTK